MGSTSYERFEEFRRILLEEKARVERAFRNIAEGSLRNAQKDFLGEDSVYDQHPADIATETFARERDLGLKDALETDRAKIERALRRIDEGTYGICEGCGREIPEERLRAVPTATLCIECQKEVEVAPRSRRPIEEEVIKPGFPDEGEGNEEQPGDEPPLR
ncbi:MAG: TraR/DksA C4-type zinc finger protein [Firmicutes bacterium]|nr:TraR/DksA C4-type zinc finger protein [Candidatus Fermentithermobacillaceae bacterium]